MDYFIGTICIFPFSYAPQGWNLCDGTVLQINANQALYSLLGTKYGGDGVKTFALPDLRGRALLASGTSVVSGTVYQNGNKGGAETVTLTVPQIPAHNHLYAACNLAATVQEPNDILAKPSNLSPYVAPPTNFPTGTVTLNPGSVVALGGAASTAHTNLQPYLTLNFCICISGIYPPRD